MSEHALFALWRQAPQHHISCLAILPQRHTLQNHVNESSCLDNISHHNECNDIKDGQQRLDCTSNTRHLITGSDTGQICLWRRRKSLSLKTSQSKLNGVEETIQRLCDEESVSQKNLFKPLAFVIPRRNVIAVTAVTACWFEQTSVFVVGYADGFMTVHDLVSGDCISCVHIFPLHFVPTTLFVLPRVEHDPFLHIACAPTPHTQSKIVIVRVGLGEGYRGSLSLLVSLNHFRQNTANDNIEECDDEVKIVSAQLICPSTHLDANKNNCSHNVMLLSLTDDAELILWSRSKLSSSWNIIGRHQLSNTPNVVMSFIVAPSFQHILLLFQTESILASLTIPNQTNSQFSVHIDKYTEIIPATTTIVSLRDNIIIGIDAQTHVIVYEYNTLSLHKLAVHTHKIHSIIHTHKSVVCVYDDNDDVMIIAGGNIPSSAIAELSWKHFPTVRLSSIRDEFPVINDNPCTALHITNCGPQLIAGFRDGCLMCQQLDCDLLRRELIGHRHAVTTVFTIQYTHTSIIPHHHHHHHHHHSTQSSTAKRTTILFSGGADGTVFVWSLSTYECLARVFAHAGAIVRFQVVAPNLVIAIADDNGFSLYKIRSHNNPNTDISIMKILLASGHDSPIMNVMCNSWCKLSNLIVSATRSDKGLCIYVWSISSGNLDRVLCGSAARAFLISRGLATGVLHEQSADSLPTRSLDDLKLYDVEVGDSNLIRSLECLPKTLLNVDIIVLDIIATLRMIPVQNLKSPLLCLALSLLLNWGLDTALDTDLRQDLSLIDISSLIRESISSSTTLSFAALGSRLHSSSSSTASLPLSITLLLPSACASSRSSVIGRFEFSYRFCAVHILYLSTITMALMNNKNCTGAIQALLSRVIATYTIVLPDALSTYTEPSLRIVCSYGVHSCEPIHTASRLLLHGAVERMSERRRQEVFQEWAIVFDRLTPSSPSSDGGANRRLQWSKRRHRSRLSRDYAPDKTIGNFDFSSDVDERLMASLLLCLIGAQFRSSKWSIFRSSSPLFTVSLRGRVTTSLLSVLEGVTIRTLAKQHEPVRVKLALDLLGRGAHLWRVFINDFDFLLGQLLALQQPTSSVAAYASRALIELAAVDTDAFISAMGKHALRSHHASASLRSSAIRSVLLLVKKYPFTFFGAGTLSATVSMMMQCLDPSEPTTRRVLVRATTSLLHTMTHNFPVMDFHQISQMLAISDNSSNHDIIIFDLRTSTKWCSLHGHTSMVNAVAFNASGHLLASYAASETPPTLRIWKIGASTLFSGLLGLRSSEIRTIAVAPTTIKATFIELLRDVHLSWPDTTSVKLVREDRSICCFSI